MAEENIHKQEFTVRNLQTRNVTFYPTRAHIVRDINDITLKPGANEITILGLTPTADETSIKVDGKGSATITDMMVELIPNPDIYENVYPESEDDVEESEDDQSESEPESDATKALADEKRRNDGSVMEANEEKKAAASRLAMLESYGRSFEKDRPNDLKGCISAYREERKKAFEVHKESEDKIKTLEKERFNILKRQVKDSKVTVKEKGKASKEKSKKLEKKQKLLQEKSNAKRSLKEERVQFWPRRVYRVTLSLDTNSELTPASSRRGSIDNLTKPTLESPSSDSCQISLSVSYITNSAYWSPRYDLSLDTVASSGLIIYRAEFCNTTSETWKDAQVILSTSQTSFQGLGEPIPTMLPWHIRLSKGLSGTADGTNGALMSVYEMENRRKGPMNVASRSIEPRNVLFGLSGVSFAPQQAAFKGQQQAMQNVQRQQQMQQQYVQQQQMQQAQVQAGFGQAAQQQSASAGLFGSSNAPSNVASSNSALFGSSSAGIPSTERNDALQDYQMQMMLLEQQNKKRMLMARQEQDTVRGAVGYGEGLDDGNAETIIPDLPTLGTQESEWTESGLTTTYGIPGLRTVAPSFTTRRHKIASVHLKDVHLSYVLVPKLRVAAFLKARLRNTSSVALLKGPAGLTLDGSFLGNTNLPRCSAGEHFHLSLGVDPSVNVTYSKPVVKRSQTGVFNFTKECSGVYTRTCTITNTKSNRAIEGTVLDQIPVSEEDRLRVEVLQPLGLKTEGDAVKTGTGVVGKGKETWGRATAVLKKGGEVAWEVKIEPGRGAKLVLEYEAKFPSAETVVCV